MQVDTTCRKGKHVYISTACTYMHVIRGNVAAKGMIYSVDFGNQQTTAPMMLPELPPRRIPQGRTV